MYNQETYLVAGFPLDVASSTDGTGTNARFPDQIDEIVLDWNGGKNRLYILETVGDAALNPPTAVVSLLNPA